MKATIKHTTHANLKPGQEVEVTGYCAKVTARFDDATPNAKPKEETREVFFGLGDLTLICRDCPKPIGNLQDVVCVECFNRQSATPHPGTATSAEQFAAGGYEFTAKTLEIPADLPKPPATPASAVKTPTAAPQSAEVGYLADILNALRDLYELLNADIQERDARRRNES